MRLLGSVHDRAQEQAIERAAARLSRGLKDDPRRSLSLALRSAIALAPGRGEQQLASHAYDYLVKAFASDLRPMPAQSLCRAIDAVSEDCIERLVSNVALWIARGSGRRLQAQQELGASPLVILISPSMRCNMKCKGCYAAEYDHSDGLSIDIIDRVITEASALGTFAVTLLGGEPLLRADVLDLVERHREMTFQIFTNGTLIDSRVAERLAAAGNVLVSVSIDGARAQHDKRRGDGSLELVERGMARLRAQGVPFGFSTMITSQNCEYVIADAFVDYLIGQGCLWGWHFMYMPVGDSPDLRLMPTPEQREYLRTQGAARIRSRKPIFVIDFWNDAPYVGGCIAAGREYLHINSRGDVEPCIFTHFSVDNVREKCLSDVLRSPYFEGIRARQPYDSNLLRPCMLIDNTHVVREVVGSTGARPTHPEAELLLTTLAPGLDAYAAEYKQIADVAWSASPAPSVH